MGVLKVGFIGTGPRANSIFNNLIMNKNLEDKVELTCALDADPKMLNEWRLKVMDNGLFSNLDAMLKFHDLDAVLIITPPSTHAGFAEKCLQAGLHVWSEVPMGLTNDELFRIIDAEKSNKGNKGKYFYGENYCYMNHIQFVKEKYQNNKIGEIYYTEGEYCHSVEHYMIFENFLNTKGIESDIDPELAKNPKPTWRATFQPIIYGHHIGPCF
jgi:predicted dehydrogenase